MNIAVMMILSLVILLFGYRFYGRYVARQLGIDENIPTPAVRINDGVDFVPTKPVVLFGHHFAAIAAAGPIVGPTLALLFGFGPAWLWIILGVIFIGAVHDFSSLFISVREGGRSVAEVARKVFGKTTFIFYVAFAILLCLLVNAAFLQLTVTALTSNVPPDDVNLTQGQHILATTATGNIQIGGVASASVVVMTLIAPLIGFLIYKKRVNVIIMSIVAFMVSFASVVIGFFYPVTLAPNLWLIIITIYVFFAAWIPVWIILQPRDFTNAQILYLGILSMVVGVIGSGIHGVKIAFPLFNLSEAMDISNLGLIWPFLFVTIACGAASGAHGLVCGGTSSKQINNEKYIPTIGYGGMLLEGLLAVCVLLILVGGLGYEKYKSLVYPIQGISNAPLAFALGLGKVLENAIGLPTIYGTAWGILLLEGFLITTIDALVRLCRYLFEELWLNLFGEATPVLLKSKIVNSLLVILGMSVLAYTNGYKAIWPIFGSANQLLAALTLIATTAWLAQKAKNYWFTAIPALFMILTTITSLAILLKRYAQASNWSLTITDAVLLGLAGGVVFVVAKYFFNLRKKLVVLSMAGK